MVLLKIDESKGWWIPCLKKRQEAVREQNDSASTTDAI